MSDAIPTPETITADWLTARLREAGHGGASVRGYTETRIGTGQMGYCIRYDMDLDGADAAVPRRLIGKFPSDDPMSRQTGVTLRSFLKEVNFYRELQSRLSIRTPKCYFAEIDGEGPDFMLLLEDMAPAEQGDQLAGCSPAIAGAAVQQLVGLHAPSWCDDSLRGFEWLSEATEESIATFRGLYNACLPGFLDRFRDRLAADEAAIFEQVAESQGPPFVLLGDTFGLTHVDYRLDNLLIDDSEPSPSITAVDWQGVTLGNPLSDVAYFMGAGLLPEVRRDCERGIVEHYYASLCESGVSDYAWDDCWTDYRRGTFSGFAVTVIASVMVVQTERGEEMFTAMARRHARHAIDLGSEEFLTI